MKVLRQGDVLMVRVARLPKNVQEVPIDNGRVILAYGEVTGHAHAIVVDRVAPVAKLWSANAERFLQVMENSVVTKDVVSVVVGLDGTPFKIGEEIFYGVALKHEEHTAQVIPPGIYHIAIQTEYTPEALRNVAD
jgi:hypothetical protein